MSHLRFRHRRRPSLAVLSLAFSIFTAGRAEAVPQPPPAALDARTLTLPAGPGSLRGMADDPSVDAFSAQVAYRIPIEVPKGRAGVQPDVALVYDGALGNGPVGLGFSLGTPKIQRSTRLGVPHYAATDEIELVGIGGGGRLVADGAGAYRVEGKGNALRVVQVGQGWEVTDTDGIVHVFGDTAASRVEGTPGVAVWNLARSRQRSGDTIEYAYTKDENGTYLDRITYGADGTLTVRFVYQTRTLDPSASYRTGFRVGLRKRLSSIDTYVGAAKARSYELTYDATSTLSRLASVRCVAATKETLPTVSLAYGARSAPAVTAMTQTGGWALYTNDVLLVDVDGDGLSDLARFATTGYSYRRNLGDRFAPEVPISGALTGLRSSAQIRLMSMHGKNLPELVYAQGTTWQLLRLEAGQWVPGGAWASAGPLPSLTATTVEFTDLDGDGRTDAIEDRGTSLSVRFSGPNGFGPTATRSAPSAGAIRPGVPGVRFQDMNGDGLADAVQLTTTRVTVWPGMGDGSFDTTSYAMTGFTATTLDDLRLADLDRDGVTDVVVVLGNTVTPWFASPTGALRRGTTATAPTAVTPDLRVGIGDLNGNGSDDVIWSNAQGTWCLDLAGPTSAGMLTQIWNGLGAQTIVAYTPSSLLALGAELSPTEPDWVEKIPVSIPVPTSTQLVLASGGTRTTRTLVRDGFWDRDEQRFGGFLGATRYLDGDGPADTLVETMVFEAGHGPDRVLRGLTRSTERRDGNGLLLSRESATWEARHLAALPGTDPLLAVPLATQRRTEHVEGSAVPVAATVDYVFDDDGNVTEEHASGRLDRVADERHVFRTYAHDDTTWVRGRPVTERVEGPGGAVLADRRFRYDDAGGGVPLALGVVSNGRLRLVERRHIESGRWVTERAYDHDAWGNPIRTTEHGVTRELAYDPDARFPISETLRPSSTESLVWSATWNATLGVVASLTDPNGVVTNVTSDGLGRPTAIATGTAAPHVTHAYTWTSPRPRTTTTRVDGAFTRISHDVRDSHGEPLYEASELGAGALVVEGHVVRSARGVPTRVLEPYDASALPASAPASTAVTLIESDALGRETRRVLPNAVTRTTAYGPLSTTETTTGLAPVTRTLSPWGQVIATSRTVGATTETSASSYDAEGRLTSVSLQGGAVVHAYTYDSLGRLVDASDPDGGSVTFSHDDRGFLTERRNAEGQRVTYANDDLGRVVRKSVTGGGSYTMQYDRPLTGASTTNARGRLAGVIEPTGRVELAYDESGSATKMFREVDGRSGKLLRTYGPNGLLLTESSDVDALDFEYDGAGRLVRIGDVWRASMLDAAGRVVEERFSNGVSSTFGYDAAGQVDRVEVRDGSSSYTRLLTLAVTQRTPFGAPAAIADTDGHGLDHAATYGYDAASRLTSATTAGRTFGYGYDALGNMVRRTAAGASLPAALGTYTYGGSGAGPRQLTTAGSTKIVYDRAGRATQIGKATLVHDGDDHLGTHAGTGKVNYAYGYEGARVRSSGGAIDERVYFRELCERGSTREHLVFAGDRLLARLAARPSPIAGPALPPAATLVHAGLDGAPVLLTNDAGAVVDERRYEPYGAPIEADLAREPYASSNHPADVTTGLVDHGARWLAPLVGRWLTPDPIGREAREDLAASPWRLSPYAYAGNDPITRWDPDGRDDETRGRIQRYGTAGAKPPVRPTEKPKLPSVKVNGRRDYEVKAGSVSYKRKDDREQLTVKRGPVSASYAQGVENGKSYSELSAKVEVSKGPASAGAETGGRAHVEGVEWNDGSGTTVGVHWWTRAWAKVTAFGRGGTVETKREGDTSIATHDLARALGLDSVGDRMRTPDRR